MNNKNEYKVYPEINHPGVVDYDAHYVMIVEKDGEKVDLSKISFTANNDEVKFNDLEKKVFKFVCFLGCLIIRMMLESYDKKLMGARDKKKYRHKNFKKSSN